MQAYVQPVVRKHDECEVGDMQCALAVSMGKRDKHTDVHATDNKEMQKGGDIVESDNNGKAAGAAAPREGARAAAGLPRGDKGAISERSRKFIKFTPLNAAKKINQHSFRA